MKYEINTSILSDDDILQEVAFVNDQGVRETIIREIFELREQGIIDALHKLGWRKEVTDEPK